MRKRFIITGISSIVIIAALVLLVSSKRTARPIKSEPYQDTSDKLATSLYNEAGSYARKGDFLKAKDTYKKLLEEHPNSSLVKNTRSGLDDVNIKILFSPIQTDDSISYEVQPGDTLVKIARNFGTTVELIMKSNGLTDTVIKPQTQLKISKAKFSILVDKSQNILILKVNDEVLKTYIVSTGADNSTPIGTFKIINKLVSPTWYKAGTVVPPGSPDNILGSRWLGLDIPGYGIHGTTDESTIGSHITQGCIRMKDRDVEELYSIIPVATEVTIID